MKKKQNYQISLRNIKYVPRYLGNLCKARIRKKAIPTYQESLLTILLKEFFCRKKQEDAQELHPF